MLNKIYLTTSISTYLCNDNSVSDTFLHLQSVCLVYLPPPQIFGPTVESLQV